MRGRQVSSMGGAQAGRRPSRSLPPGVLLRFRSWQGRGRAKATASDLKQPGLAKAASLPRSSGVRRLFKGPAVRVVSFVAVFGLAILAWAVWPASDKSSQPRARIYSSYSACLLTDAAGIIPAAAKTVWSGMEAASSATSMKVSFLAAVSPGDAADVQSYLNTLLQRRCDVIVAVGAPQTAAVTALAGANPKTHFVVVGAPSSGLNVAPVNGTGDEISAAVKQDLVASNAGRFDRWAQGAAK